MDRLTQRTADAPALLVAAALMITSGVVHLHLWDIAYRHVATLGPLFLVQTIAALVAAVVLATTRLVIILLGSAALMLGTVVGFLLADTVGLFGFTLPEVTQWAYLALASELLSVAIVATVLFRHFRHPSASP